MAKKSKLMRELRCAKLVKKFGPVRIAIKEDIRVTDDIQVKEALRVKLAKLPANSNPVRFKRRCQTCGRSRGVYKKFGLCRICLRNNFNVGNIPGAVKSSW